jgi:FHA domain
MTEQHVNSPRRGGELQALQAAQQTGLSFLYWRDGGERLQFLMLGTQSQAEAPTSRPRSAEPVATTKWLPSPDHPVTIGRRESADVPLPWDGQVSRQHATLHPAGHDWKVVDEDSTNGTWVNGCRISAGKRLNNKDHLVLGETRVDYWSGEGHGSVSTARAAGSYSGIELTPRKRKVLIALCRPVFVEGATTPATNPQIAEEVSMAIDTVKGILKELFEQFGLAAVAQNEKRSRLVATVREHKLLAPHDF